MSSQSKDDRSDQNVSNEWKKEGHPWVDNDLQVTSTFAVPFSSNAASNTALTGSVIGFGPVNENLRKPAMGRVIYEPPPQPPSLRSIPDNVVLAMDVTATEMQEMQQASGSHGSPTKGAADAAMTNDANANATTEAGAGASTTTTQQQTLRMPSSFPMSSTSDLIQNVQERYQTRLEQYLQESVLPPLIALAALEEATSQMVKQRIIQEDAEQAARAHSSNNNNNDSAASKLSSPHPPLYYSKSPNQYMSLPAPTPSVPAPQPSNNDSSGGGGGGVGNDDPMKEHLSSTPNAWLARIKFGCQQAWNEYVAQQQHDQQLLELYTAAATTAAASSASSSHQVELSSGRRSSSRIARIATEQWEQATAELTNFQKKSHKNQHQQQRQTRRQTAQVESGVEIYLRGHRISNYLQHKLQEERMAATAQDDDSDDENEHDEEEHEEEEDDEEEEEEEEEDDEDDMDLFNPHLQPAYGDVLKSLRKIRLEDIQNSIPHWCQDIHKRSNPKVMREQLDEEEEMENVLEVDLLPLDPLILGIEEKKVEEEEEEEEATEHGVGEEEVNHDDNTGKMEVEPETTTTEPATGDTKDKTSSSSPVEDAKAKENGAEKEECTTTEKPSETTSPGETKAPESSSSTTEAKATVDAASEEAKKTDDPKEEDKVEENNNKTIVPDESSPSTTEAKAMVSTASEEAKKTDDTKEEGKVEETTNNNKCPPSEEVSGKAESAVASSESKGEESKADNGEAKEESVVPADAPSEDNKPSTGDGKEETTDNTTSKDIVPDVEMKDEPCSVESNGVREEVKDAADSSNNKDSGDDKKSVKEESADMPQKTESSTVGMEIVKEDDVKSESIETQKNPNDKDHKMEESPKDAKDGENDTKLEEKVNNTEEEEEESHHLLTENLILQWDIPDSVEKAPSKKLVHKYLQSQDNYSFGRTSFCIRSKDQEIERLRQELEPPVPDEGELLRQQEELARRKEVEKAFQTQKIWAKWRFEGIHGGYTVWPKWQDAVKKWQSERNAKQQQSEGSATGGTTTSTDQVEADRAKALELAEQNEAEAAAATGTAASRRTRRKGTSSSGPVFYGQSSQLTGRQLVELILRLCSDKSTAPTILQLQSTVAEDGTQDPVRRLRTALGKLVWRRNQLSRLTPSTDWTDKTLLNTVRERPLLHIAAAPAPETVAPAAQTNEDNSGDGKDVEMKDASIAADDKQPVIEHTEEQDALVKYLQRLHETELQLRKVVLDHLTEIPIPIVATAADEKKGSNEGYDSADFEDQANVDWQSEGHELIGKHIFRPRNMNNTNDLSECEWFTIKFYVPSVPCEAAPDDPQFVAGSNVKDSPLVDRRMRFRAAPFLEEDADAVEFEDDEYVVLTEAQAIAGIKAAELEQINIDREEEEDKVAIIDHPFGGSGISAKITLYPIVKSKKKDETGLIQCTVVGHGSLLGDGNVETIHRILVLPYITDANPVPTSIWGTLDVSDDTEIRCKLDNDPNNYRVQQSDFHPESQAFAECRKIVEFLENHQKATPFLEPVDPVALGIPDYTKVITNPMDISTLSEKLEHGIYSNVPPKQSVGGYRSPVARMLNSHFRDDVELIFDNAMLFNPPNDWIHQDAATLKKAVVRKIDSISQSADTKFRRSGRSETKQSIYLDEDSDVDMYEYESDQDDDDDFGGGRRKRKRGKGPVRPKADDNSTRAMEHSIRLQKTISETLGLRGPLTNLQVEHDASSFVHPPNWNCRRRKAGANKKVDTIPEEEDDESDTNKADGKKDKHEEQMQQLVELQRTLEETETAGLRRSTRAVAHDEGGSRRRNKKSSSNKSDIEYYMLNRLELDHVESSEELSRMPPPSTRLDVEYLCERLHDSFYAKLHQHFSEVLEQVKDSNKDEAEEKEKGGDELPLGTFVNGSFPPYLGRMVPVSLAKHEKFSWEIRAPFQIPALRWVIRGLIQSGHIGELEPLEQESMSSGVILANNVYYTDSNLQPFEVLDSKELARRRRANNEEEESSEDEVELSAYEQARAERVARNAERLKALGLA